LSPASGDREHDELFIGRQHLVTSSRIEVLCFRVYFVE
jgi:hypothetical protein